MGSLESLVCALEHENGIGDLEGGAKFDAHDLHNVGLGEQQEGLPVNHLKRRRRNSGDVSGHTHEWVDKKKQDYLIIQYSSP